MRPGSPRSSLAAAVIGIVAFVALIGACQPAAGDALTDPRDILARTIRETARVQTMAVRIDVEIRGVAEGQLPTGGGMLEAQLDLGRLEVSGRAADHRGAESGRAIVVDGSLFATSGGRWTRMPVDDRLLANPIMLLAGGGFGGIGGDGPDHFAILSQAVNDPSMAVSLDGVTECSAGRCYRTIVDIPPDAAWALLVKLTGLDRIPGAPVAQPPEGQIPAISLSILSDTATLRLIEIASAVTNQGDRTQVRLQLANHDAPVSIEPPPPELVDEGPDFGGGMRGGGFAPAPMPVEPVQPVPFEP